MTPMPTDLLIALRNIFATHFDGDGLNDFALALGIDYENLSGSSKSAKARELALFLWRHSKLNKLAEVGPEQRPDIEWANVLGPYVSPADEEIEEDEPDPIPDVKLDRRELNKIIRILSDYPMFLTPSGRKTVLTLAGLEGIANIDLNGNTREVASILAVQLNEYGKTGEGDLAIGRLMAFIAIDDALPPSQKEILTTIAAKYGITLE